MVEVVVLRQVTTLVVWVRGIGLKSARLKAWFIR